MTDSGMSDPSSCPSRSSLRLRVLASFAANEMHSPPHIYNEDLCVRVYTGRNPTPCARNPWRENENDTENKPSRAAYNSNELAFIMKKHIITVEWAEPEEARNQQTSTNRKKESIKHENEAHICVIKLRASSSREAI